MYQKKIMQTQEIATRCNIPKAYLEQLFNRLRKAGLIKSIRGNKGGYTLAQSPEEIDIYTILTTLEGKDPVSEGYSLKSAVQAVFAEAEASIQKTLEIPLSQLVNKQEQLDGILNFEI